MDAISQRTGDLPTTQNRGSATSEKLAGAIAVRFTLQPGEKKIIPMVIWLGFSRGAVRRRTKVGPALHGFLWHLGQNAWKIARDGLLHAAEWSDAIDKWQAPYINDESKPLWYRGMLFNELYALTDGGTFWGRQVGSDPKAAAIVRAAGVLRLCLLRDTRCALLCIAAAAEVLAGDR